MTRQRAGMVKVGHKIASRVLENRYLHEEIYQFEPFSDLLTAPDPQCICGASSEFS
jgi:hypothetical protein